jgi:hypothetical protein
MAHSQLGNPEEARCWFTRALAEIDRDYRGHPELLRLCEEAGALLAAHAPISDVAIGDRS